jgi:hypothetical protein
MESLASKDALRFVCLLCEKKVGLTTLEAGVESQSPEAGFPGVSAFHPFDLAA